MSLAGLMTQPLTIQNRTQQVMDGYGQLSWMPDGDPITVRGKIRVSSSVETLNDSDVVVTQRKAIVPAGTNVNAYATITFQDQTWEVDGNPNQVWHPRLARVEYIECQLTEVAGG